MNTTISSAQSTCGNRDFEDTTFTNWSGATGMNTGINATVNWVSGFASNGNNTSLSDALAHHTLTTTNFVDTLIIDPATGLPDQYMTSLAPGGGNVSLRLGGTVPNAQTEKLTYSFLVTSTDSVFTYQFACVQEDPGHMPAEQPYFMVNMYDQSMSIITSGTDTFYSAQTDVPFITSTNVVSPLKYRRWTYISVNLSAYIGQIVTIEFINSDCALGGHYGYTYIDLPCLGTLFANVWPGDCDNDLQANNVDLLSLGIAMGATGTARTLASNNWIAQASADWGTSFPLGANYKHSDCNGDGVIDLNDTLAISLNYSLTHPLRLAEQEETAAISANLPPLRLVPSVTAIG